MPAVANRRTAKTDGADYYPTPAWAVRALLEQEKFEGWIDEPACGAGHMSRALIKGGYKVRSADLHDYGYGLFGRDARKIGKTENIVTNPPFNLASELVSVFVRSASKKVAILTRLAFLESGRRYPLFKRYPPARIYIFPERLSLTKNGKPMKNKKGKKSTGGTVAYMWIVWDKKHKGKPEIFWLKPGHKVAGLE